MLGEVLQEVQSPGFHMCEPRRERCVDYVHSVGRAGDLSQEAWVSIPGFAMDQLHNWSRAQVPLGCCRERAAVRALVSWDRKQGGTSCFTISQVGGAPGTHCFIVS